MTSIAREEPDPSLDLQYPEHCVPNGYNSFYPYRPVATFLDRLVAAERCEAAKQRKQTHTEQQLELDTIHAESCALPVQEQVARTLSALPENDAFTTRHSNYGHSGPIVGDVQEYGMLHDGSAVQIPFRLPASPDAPATYTELEIQKFIGRHKGKSDVASTGNNIIKRIRRGERPYRDAEGFPSTDAGIRNASQNVQYQRKWHRKNPNDGAPAESALQWLARAEQRLPQHVSELQRMLGWKKAAAEMKRAEGDIASLRARLGQRVDDESG